MAPKKKKKVQKPKVFNEETLSGRRSSLQVNLSFVSNLSDSGNESLRRTQLENNEFTQQESRFLPRLRGELSNIRENTSSIVCAENAAISAINEREQALDQSCQLLKVAILSKTRELFDQKAELSVKTTNILKGQRQALKEINKDSNSVGIKNKKSVLSKSSSMKNPPSKKLSASQSFVSRSKSDLSFVRISNNDRSFILSGSNKSHRNRLSPKINKVLKVRLTRLEDSLSKTSSNLSQCSSIGDDIGAPLTCSSFLSNCGNRAVSASQQAESDYREISKNPDAVKSVRRVGESSCSLTPMEITAVQGPIPSTSKNSISLRLRSSINKRARDPTNLKNLGDVPMELTPVQSHIPSHDLPDSNKTRTSLNVNTSTDEITDNHEKRNSVQAMIVPEDENTRVDHVSLKVNTSLGSGKSPMQETEKSTEISKTERSKISTNTTANRSRKRKVDSTDNISLIARLRNLSSRKSKEPADNSKSDQSHRSSHGDGPSFVEGTPLPLNTSVRTDNFEQMNRSSRGDGPSFIEGTPFPPSRSVLWRTRIENAIRNRTERKVNPPPPVDPDSDSSTGTEFWTPPNDTVIVDSSPSRHTCNVTDPRIIEDSSDNEEPAETACTNVPLPKENTTPNIQRPGKKKLLTLHQDLVLVSLSPLSPAVLSPKKPIEWKPIKKRKKLKAVREKAAKRIESSRVEEEDETVCSVVSRIQTQKEKAKGKKPRKVISKKIVVKKIAGKEILEQLEGMGQSTSDFDSTNGQRGSISEFTKKRRLTIPGRVLKAQKLVIVATGFSKGDVDLVKSVVKDLGGAKIGSTVTRRTTHVVTTGVRTINLLRGIIRGCWLVSLDWVLKSLEREKWLDAEQYEMSHFSKAVQENRRDRQLFGNAYVPELFTTCGPIYIEKGSTPPPEILKELVKTAGGRISEHCRDAKLTVGPEGLREIWILDSITTGDLQPIADYMRENKNHD